MAKRMTVKRMMEVIRQYVPEELSREITDELSHRIAEPPDYEGDRLCIMEVCPECHGALKGHEHYCDICGKAILRTKVKI